MTRKFQGTWAPITEAQQEKICGAVLRDFPTIRVNWSEHHLIVWLDGVEIQLTRRNPVTGLQARVG